MIDFDSLLLGPCMQAFGEPVIYTPAGYQPLPIQAVFLRSSMQLLPMGGSGGQEPYMLGASGDLTTREPALGLQVSQLYQALPAPHGDDLELLIGLSDAPAPVTALAMPTQGDTALIVSLGLLYEVKEVLPDGVGHARLTLTLLGNH